jgi:DNA-binding transcriptional LysR family regulator
MLDIRCLKSFLVVAEEGNVSRAARQLHVSQPALTRRIQELERELGFALFEQLGRGIRITGEGRSFLAHCRDLLAHVEMVEDRARSYSRGKSGVLNVGASPQMLERVFPRVLRRYKAIFPMVDVVLIEDTSQANLKALIHGEIDLAIIPPSTDRQVESCALKPLSVVAAVPKGHPLSQSKRPDIRLLSNSPVMVLHEGFLARKAFDAACKLAQIEPRLTLESGAPHTILALAEAGLGAAIVPSTVRINSRKLYPAPLYYDGAPLQIVASVSWLRQRHMPAYKTGFIEEFVNAAEQELSLD